MWGIEIDGSWVGVSRTTTFDPNGGPAASETLTNRLDAILTARLRTGVALDNMLLYVTGGVAAARFRTTWEDLKSEVLYANFADRDHTVTFPGFGPASFTHSDAVWISRIGVNYKFSYAPVRAAY